jgi:hypothetical protein
MVEQVRHIVSEGRERTFHSIHHLLDRLESLFDLIRCPLERKRHLLECVV